MSAPVSGGVCGSASPWEVMRIGWGRVCKGLRTCLAYGTGLVSVMDCGAGNDGRVF